MTMDSDDNSNDVVIPTPAPNPTKISIDDKSDGNDALEESGLFAGLQLSPASPTEPKRMNNTGTSSTSSRSDALFEAEDEIPELVVDEDHDMSELNDVSTSISSGGISSGGISSGGEKDFTISSSTPIRNADSCLRLIRKFHSKSSRYVPSCYGGEQARSIWSYFQSSSSASDIPPEYYHYQQLSKIVSSNDNKNKNTNTDDKETEDVVNTILGTGNAEQARKCLCHFVLWLSSSVKQEAREDPSSGGNNTEELMIIMGMDCATELVAHGCLDGVLMALGKQQPQAVMAHVASSVLRVDLNSERVELASLKFLLTAGCRNVNGSQLLQTIRVCYHVYLKTRSEPNKITARAALRQITVSVFCKLQDLPINYTSKEFTTQQHKDAFLVLRSLCKLSMRSLPNTAPSSTTASNSTVSTANITTSNNNHIPAATIEIAPSNEAALESKILALDLLLYVLQHSPCSKLMGPQFVYALRNYLCVSLLKNCTSNNTTVVNLSLRLFVPLIRHFRSHLKTEIEAFVTNVFFVILNSPNSTVEHKLLVVILFQEICSDPNTLAEIFLNYDCDLSAVDLFQRIVNSLTKVAKFHQKTEHTEKTRQELRQLRLEAMKAVRQILSSLHASIVSPHPIHPSTDTLDDDTISQSVHTSTDNLSQTSPLPSPDTSNKKEYAVKQTLVQIYDSKKKRREEEASAILKFNQKPSAGMKYAHSCGLINADDPADVAQYLLQRKDDLDKTQIGEYLGREPEYQNGFPLKLLNEYVHQLNFEGLSFDEAIRYYLSGFRLPGEAQKIDRIMEKFAERFTIQNPDVFPTADAAFILAFSIIMLNTDLHNPAIKEERRMTKDGFIRNNRGICDGQDLPEELLTDIFDRIQSNPISLKEDDEAREKVGHGKKSEASSVVNALNPAVFFANHYAEINRARETNFQKERDQIVRNTESVLRRKKQKLNIRHNHSTQQQSVKFVHAQESGLKDEYVVPMFDVTWGPALSVFSTAMESANGAMEALYAIASEDELELATENESLTMDVCLNGFQLAICTAGLCGNTTARSAYMRALSNFSTLGNGQLLAYRHIRCIHTLLELGRDDGELLGNTWEFVFRGLSEVARLNQVYELTARSHRKQQRRREKAEEKAAQVLAAASEEQPEDVLSKEDSAVVSEEEYSDEEDDDDSYLSAFTEDLFEGINQRRVDEFNAYALHEHISEDMTDAIYHRSASLSSPAAMDFVYQLCRVSRMEITGYGGHVGSEANSVDLTEIHHLQHHTLLSSNNDNDYPHGKLAHNQPNIFSLQKLVEVTHYNMDSRPKLVFANIWSTVSAHLTSTALHSNAAVGMYAIDSFRQLTIHFLKFQELDVFEFQRRFLKPLETVMLKSEHTSVKELLLKCIEQTILLFGQGTSTKIPLNQDSSSPSKISKDCNGNNPSNNRDTLRSGWKPVFAVIGIASKDKDDVIAELGFHMLTTQLRKFIFGDESDNHDIQGRHDPASFFILRAERFVDLVDALLMYVSAPREAMSVTSIDHLVTLCNYLADPSIPLPRSKKQRRRSSSAISTTNTEVPEQEEELELWWPILLGLSRAVGDARPNIRIKALSTLFSIINTHFFCNKDESNAISSGNRDEIHLPPPQHGDLQTLQLLFRGVLTPSLEHAEVAATQSSSLALPEGFFSFTTNGDSTKPTRGGRKDRIEGNSSPGNGNHWLETTFDHLMDGCVALCLKSIEIYQTDLLIEEILAMFNNCLISDSGALAVRGLKRLYNFVTSDLSLDIVTDDTWATVCHMLRRCLKIRGLPPLPTTTTTDDVDDNAKRQEEQELLSEFVLQEEILSDRRYVFGHATLILDKLLSNQATVTSMSMRWQLFLLIGLGRGIQEWDQAANIMDMYPSRTLVASAHSPPQYSENALYARKRMVKFLVLLMNRGDVFGGVIKDPSLAPLRRKSAETAKSFIKEETSALLEFFLVKDRAVTASGFEKVKVAELEGLTKIVSDLLDGIHQLNDEDLSNLTGLTPTLSACGRVDHANVRESVNSLVKRMFDGPLSDRLQDKDNPPSKESTD